MWAVESTQQVTVTLLLDTGADIDIKTKDGYTALHLATFVGCEAIVRLLLSKGANITAEAQWRRDNDEEKEEDDDKYDDEYDDEDDRQNSGGANASAIKLRRARLLEKQVVVEEKSKEMPKLTAYQLAVIGGHKSLQRLLMDARHQESGSAVTYSHFPPGLPTNVGSSSGS